MNYQDTIHAIFREIKDNLDYNVKWIDRLLFDEEYNDTGKIKEELKNILHDLKILAKKLK